MTMTPTERAYFESEAARPMVNPNDYAFAVAVNRICDDHGHAWRVWLDTADEAVQRAICAAYEREAAGALRRRDERHARARAAFAEAKAAGKNYRAALRAARSIAGDFVPGKPE